MTPLTADPLTELVEVGQSGEVLTWAWNGEPRPMQPFDRPFAWALIRLDGADHVDAARGVRRQRRRDVHRHEGPGGVAE